MDRREFLAGAGALLATPAMANVPLLGAGSGGAGGAPFNPVTSLTGVIAWWDAQVPGSFTLAGSTVNNWMSQVNSLNMSTCCGRVQTYSATGFNTSYPGVTFPGGSNFLEVGNFPMGTGTELTMWYVGTFGTGGSRIMSYCAPGGNDYDRANSWTLASGAPFLSCGFQRNNAAINSGAGAGSPAGHRVIVTVNSSGFTSIYLNGVVSAATMTTVGNWATLGAFDFARFASHDQDFWYGIVAEGGVATGYSDATLVGQLDTYLKNKWGL